MENKSSVHSYKISQMFPLNAKARQKTFYSKAFVKTYETAMKTLDEIEKSLKEGNSSIKIENSDW